MSAAKIQTDSTTDGNETYRPVTYLSKLRMLSKFKASAKAAAAINKAKFSMKFLKKFNILKKSKAAVSTSHEINHSLHHVASKNFLNALNLVAWLYIAYDVSYRFWESRNKGYAQAFKVGADTFVWHMLASNLFPGLIISSIIGISKKNLEKFFIGRHNLVTYLSAGIALAFIPIMIKPIDQATDMLLDSTTRPYFDIKTGQPLS